MGDDAVAVLKEEQHLGVPIVGRKRPAMAENDRVARAPVLVVDLRAVFGRDRAHCSVFLSLNSIERTLSGIRADLYVSCGTMTGDFLKRPSAFYSLYCLEGKFS